MFQICKKREKIVNMIFNGYQPIEKRVSLTNY